MASAVAPPATPSTTTSADPRYAAAVAAAKAALAARSAGMNRANGLGRYRPGIPDAPNAPSAAPAPNPGAQNVDPLYAQALAQAQATLAAEQAPIQAEQAASDAQYQARQADATNNATAVSNLLSGIGPAVNGEYQTGAQNVELAANGFSQGMQDALKGNTDNLNAMLAKLGSPAQLDSHAAQSGDVLYALHGYNPGTMFSQQGANLGAAADLQSGAALLKGQENVKELQGKAIVADQGFQAKIAELAGKLPGDTQTNYQHLQTLALNDAKFREQVAHNKATEAAATARLKLEGAKYQTSVDEFNQKQALAYKRLAVSESQFAQRQANADRTYQVSLARLGIAQKKLQLSIAGNAFKQAHGGFTPAQVGKFNRTLDALQGGAGTLDTGNGTPQVYDKSKGKWVDVPASGAPPGAKVRGINTYSHFIVAALKKGVPIQLAVDRANSIWEDPSTRDSLPPSLESLPAAASAASNFGPGSGSLGFNPDGSGVVLYDVPKGLSAKGQAAVSGVLSLAREYLGTPYEWGGSSPGGFDCSGLAQYIYSKEGITIPRTTYDQFQAGLSVPRNQLQAGDLVFFNGSDAKVVNGVTLPGHVGIYIGGGKFIEAPHSGDVVKISSLAGYPGYMGARRYVH